VAYPQFNQANGEMSWDLRTIYANFIVAPNLIEIAEARGRQDFQTYWKKLNDLYIVVAHKIEAKEDKDKPFKVLQKAAADIITKNLLVFEGKAENSKASYEIDKALNDIEMYLYKKMGESDMFGAKKYQENLG
jgi:hypothetical protein